MIDPAHIKKQLAAFPWQDALTAISPDIEAILSSGWAQGYQSTPEISIPFDKAAEYGRQRGGQLITDVSGTTHDRVVEVVQGLLGETFDATDVSESDLSSAILDSFAGMADSRAATIADTETAYAANYGTLAGYRDTGVQYVLVSDGTDSDPECAAADGQTWTVDDADANALEHPRCGRSFDSLDSADVNPEDVDHP